MQRFELSTGAAHVFYPEASHDRCTAALLLDLDPVTLVRGHESSSEGGLVESYVNDRTYAVSSLMSVAIARIYPQASGERSERLELVRRTLDLLAVSTPLRVDGDELTRRLFEPLGYAVTCTPVTVPASARAGRYDAYRCRES